MLPEVVNRADIGMIEGRGGARLAAEAFEELAVLGEFFGQKLVRYAATEVSVLTLVDHTHAAVTQLL